MEKPAVKERFFASTTLPPYEVSNSRASGLCGENAVPALHIDQSGQGALASTLTSQKGGRQNWKMSPGQAVHSTPVHEGTMVEG